MDSEHPLNLNFVYKKSLCCESNVEGGIIISCLAQANKTMHGPMGRAGNPFRK